MDSNPRSPVRRIYANTSEIVADREPVGAGRWENGENADLAPLRDQRRCSPATVDRPNWAGFAIAPACAWQSRVRAKAAANGWRSMQQSVAARKKTSAWV
jgi:hypothetical protein